AAGPRRGSRRRRARGGGRARATSRAPSFGPLRQAETHARGAELGIGAERGERGRALLDARGEAPAADTGRLAPALADDDELADVAPHVARPGRGLVVDRRAGLGAVELAADRLRLPAAEVRRPDRAPERDGRPVGARGEPRRIRAARRLRVPERRLLPLRL